MQVPGLYVAPKNGAFDYINCSLQGSRCEDILWLVDGVRTANRLYNTTTPLDTIPASMIERVEVLYGGQGIFYGTQSVAGVVNVVTKSFSGDPTGQLQPRPRRERRHAPRAATSAPGSAITRSCCSRRRTNPTDFTRSRTATTSRAPRTAIAATT